MRERRRFPPSQARPCRCARRQTRAPCNRRFFPSTSRPPKECRLYSCNLNFYVRCRFVANEGADIAPEYCISNATGLVHVEHDDRDLVVHAKTEGSGVHDLQPSRQCLGEREAVESSRVRVFVGIAIVNPVNLGCFEDYIGADFACSQSRRGVGRKVWISSPGCEDDDATQLEMANGAPEDERLGHIPHVDSSLHTRFDPHVVECAAQRKRVDYCGQHSHVIGGRTVHSPVRGRNTAPDVTTADHNRHLHIEVAHLFYALGDVTHYSERNVIPGAALLHCFAAQLQHHALINWRFCFHGRKQISKQKIAMFGKQNAKQRGHLARTVKPRTTGTLGESHLHAWPTETAGKMPAGTGRMPALPNQSSAPSSAACPRKNSAALIRLFPSNCTLSRESAFLPPAMTSPFSLRRISPGLPLRPTTDAEKILRF